MWLHIYIDHVVTPSKWQISPTEIRGALGSVNQLFICVGILVALVAGLPLSGNPIWYWVVSPYHLFPEGVYFSPNLFVSCLFVSWWLISGDGKMHVKDGGYHIRCKKFSLLLLVLLYTHTHWHTRWERERGEETRFAKIIMGGYLYPKYFLNKNWC